MAFWLLVTAAGIMKHDPEALETPLAWLAVTWVVYLPVFGLGAVLPVATARYFGLALPMWVGAIASGGIAATVAATVFTPNAASLSACVGALVGSIVAKSDRRERMTDPSA